jgi:hypothetical protein
MDTLIRTFAERGDLAHLALLVWALSASLAFWRVLGELSRATRRFDDFIREIASFNARYDDPSKGS